MVESDLAENNCHQTEPTTELKQRSIVTNGLSKKLNQKEEIKQNSYDTWAIKDLNWKNVLFFAYLHAGSVYALYLIFTGQVKVFTILFSILLINIGLLGITAGAHRLWSHKAYKAKWQLKLILTIFNTISHQNGIWVWVLDHRVHHKYQDSHADPHNAGRGLFFSHMGWLMVTERPEVEEKRRTIDMSDCLADPFVMIQKKYYWIIMPIVSLIIPTLIPCYLVNETLSASYHVGFVLRYLYTLHDTFLINSFAHWAGTKPYDKSIRPTDHKLCAIATLGEGWHNYHHVFPWDYKTAELGNYRYNITTGFIDFFAKLGWAYDLKSVSDELVRKRMTRTGDGTTKYSKMTNDEILHTLVEHEHHTSENLVWGWDDADMQDDDKKLANIINKVE